MPNQPYPSAPLADRLTQGYLVGGRFAIVCKLAEGAIGEVYLVREPGNASLRALKILKPELLRNENVRERFQREAFTPSRIDSDHVVRVLYCGTDDSLMNTPFMVMEHLVGTDLQTLSEETGPMDPGRVLWLLRQLAHVLDKAHELGIVHRDLKPENLFIVRDESGHERLKVLDFGVAKLTGAASDGETSTTRTGDVFGTPMYMSPEQCLGRVHDIGAPTDVWALGLIAFRLLVGDELWTAENITQLIGQIAYDAIPAASARGAAFGPMFDAWFSICCARASAERFQSAGSAIRALEAVFAER